jgi:hypothetical protein
MTEPGSQVIAARLERRRAIVDFLPADKRDVREASEHEAS